MHYFSTICIFQQQSDKNLQKILKIMLRLTEKAVTPGLHDCKPFQHLPTTKNPSYEGFLQFTAVVLVSYGLATYYSVKACH